MAKPKSRKLLLTFVSILSVITFIMVLNLWFGITPNQLIDPLFVKAQYTNASTVYVPESMMQIWNDRYESENTEFLYCLYGTITDNGYVLEQMETTEVIAKENDYITYRQCQRKNNYFGLIHSHPTPLKQGYISTCELSPQDYYTFGGEGQLLMGVICGKHKVAFYGTDSLQTSYQVELVKAGAEV